jgi:hypothetical protein
MGMMYRTKKIMIIAPALALVPAVSLQKPRDDPAARKTALLVQCFATVLLPGVLISWML